MGLIDKIAETEFGYKGSKPEFDGETPNSTLHNQSSNLGIPSIDTPSSILDENDINNLNKWKSKTGKKYMDNLPT